MTFWVVALLAALLLGDAAVRGSWGAFGASAGWAVLVVWGVWTVQVRPCIRVAPDALTIVNVLRVVRIPWADVADVTMRYQIAVETRSGRRVRSWGGPALPRPKPTNRDAGPSRPADREIDVILDARARWGSDTHGSAATFGWDTPAVVAGLICVAAALASLLVAFV